MTQCEMCGRFLCRGQMRACGASCAGKLGWKDPAYRVLMKDVASRVTRGRWDSGDWLARRKPSVSKVCPSCRQTFVRSAQRRHHKHCSRRCARLDQWANSSFRQRFAATHQQVYADWGRKSSQRLKAFWRCPGARKRMRDAQSRGGAATIQKLPGCHEYLDRFGRLYTFKTGDRWERGAAAWLDRNELTWWYEPHVLFLSDGHRYIPDFWVQEWDMYLEVKGWLKRLDKVVLANQDGYRVRLIQKVADLDVVLQGVL